MKINYYSLYETVYDSIVNYYVKQGQMSEFPMHIKYQDDIYTWVDEMMYDDTVENIYLLLCSFNEWQEDNDNKDKDYYELEG
jgi:hypothetical protein